MYEPGEGSSKWAIRRYPVRGCGWGRNRRVVDAGIVGAASVHRGVSDEEGGEGLDKSQGPSPSQFHGLGSTRHEKGRRNGLPPRTGIGYQDGRRPYSAQVNATR